MRFCYYLAMNFDQLKHFLDVAQTEHMTKSARRLGIAQPALSRSIARLEEELGGKLFERLGRGLALTKEGKLAQETIANVVNEMESLKQQLDASKLEESREVRIRLSAASHIAADAMAAWMSQNPATKLTLTQTSNNMTENADVTIDSRIPDEYGLCARFEERIMVAVPKTLQLGDGPVPFSALSDLDFVSLSSQSGFTRFTHELCSRAEFEPRITFESDNPSVVRKMIGLGLGVGFWPEHSWGPVRGKDVRLLPLDTSVRRVVCIWTNPNTTSDVVSSFYEHLTRHFESCFS